MERALGRQTLAFISGIDILRDVAVEVFTLEPESIDAPATMSYPATSVAALRTS